MDVNLFNRSYRSSTLHELRKTVFNFSFLILSFILINIPLKAQKREHFLIQNYSRKDFNASSSNFALTEDKRGIVFIANYDGIISYDASQWQFFPIGNRSIAFSVANDSCNRIFVSSYGDFGYLKPDFTGTLHYFSLSKKLPPKLKLGIFWDILPTKNGVYFHSPQLIVKWQNGKVSFWENGPDSNFRFAFTIRDSLYVIQQKNDIIRLENNILNTIPNTAKFVNKGLTFIAEHNKKILLGTNQEGFYILDPATNSVNHIDTEAEQYIQLNKLYTGQTSPSAPYPYEYALGTLTGGVIILDSALQLKTILDKANGLSSNAIEDLKFDTNYNLWVATNDGVGYVQISSPWRVWNSHELSLATPNVIRKFNSRIFEGTSEGLFELSQKEIRKVSGLNSKIWDMVTLDNKVIVASQEGLFQLENDSLTELFNFSEVTRLKVLKQDKAKLLVVGHVNGITILEALQTGSFVERATANIPNSTFTSIIDDAWDSSIWTSAKFNGIYHIKNFLTENPQIIKYDTSHNLPDINQVKIFKNDKNILFATSKGFYHFNKNKEIFENDSSITTSKININDIAEDTEGNYIISIENADRSRHIEMFKRENHHYVPVSTPFKIISNVDITAIYPEGNKYIWIAGNEGLYRFDRTIKKDYTIPFNTLIRKVTVSDSLIFAGNYFDDTDTTGVPPIILDQPESFKPELEYKDNNLTFEYTAAFYEAPERTVYSYYLENNDKGWSNWTSDTKKEYNNLPAGTYIFHVKAKNIYDTEGRMASYEFTILPPWYQTTWAYAAFAVFIVLFIWFIVLAYTYRVRMQRRRLTLIVADRTYEVLAQKKEIEKQKDLLQHQYEEICNQRDSIQQKNNELQSAQYETLQANQALHELNTHLEREVEKRTQKIKTTLDQLQLKNKELDTFIYRASHDLRGPISRISGLSALAKMGFPKDADSQYVDLIDVTAKNMKVLISKLTQVHDLNNTSIKKEPVDMGQILETVRKDLEHLANEDALHYHIEVDEPLQFQSDKDLLTIILHNLLENALIFRKPRGVEQHITIQIRKVKKQLIIKVHDVGTGIHPKHMDKLFDMFYRGANESLGSGLGLYLAKMAVEKLGGKIEAESQQHEYSLFTVTLPV